MAFNRPTLPELIARVEADIKATFGLVTILRRSLFKAFARAMGGLSHLLHGYLDWISLQVFPDTAEAENMERWASIWGIERKEATFAELNIEIIGNEGGVVVDNTTYKRSDGFQYILDAEVIIPVGGIATGKIIATTAGEAGNLLIGDTVSLLSPIANVDSNANINGIILDAEDTESDESLRDRLLTRIQLPPLGGSANDYIQWALAVPGVTRAWVLPLYYGLGTVGVSFVEDGEDPIIPSPAKVAEVQEYIDYLKPVTALVTVFPPVPAPMDLTIKIKPNTTEVQDNITKELEDLIFRDATLAGSYKAPGEENDGSILLSKINQAISIAVGIEDHEIVEINGNAPANVVPLDGELITLGAITWQPLA